MSRSSKWRLIECLWCGNPRVSECCRAPLAREPDGELLCTKCETIDIEVTCDCEEERAHQRELRREARGLDGPYGGDGPDD